MSNPYAPPEDRPRTSTGAPAPEPPQAPVPGPPPGYPHHDRRPRPPEDHRPTTGRPATEPPAADPEAVARAGRLARTALLLVLASVIVLSFPVPWQVAAPVFAALGVAVSIRGLVAAMAGRVRGSASALLGLLLVVSALLAILGASMLALWGPQREHQDCLANAITVTAKAQCDRQFDQDVVELRDSLEGRARS